MTDKKKTTPPTTAAGIDHYCIYCDRPACHRWNERWVCDTCIEVQQDELADRLFNRLFNRCQS